MTNRAGAALLVLLLLVSGPLAVLLPAEIAAIRLAGVSLLWWYEGIAVPCGAVLAALLWLPDRAETPAAE